MDCFIKNLKLKVDSAVNIIMNSPVIRKKTLDSSDIPGVEEKFIHLLETSKTDIINSTSNFQNNDSEEKFTDEIKSLVVSEKESDAESFEENEQSESDSVFDVKSQFRNYYHFGIKTQDNVIPHIENSLLKKLPRQISDPGKDSTLALLANFKSKTEEKDLWNNNSDLKSQNLINDYSKFYYVSTRRDSLFDTIQLKSSMNQHLKCGDYKERLTFTVAKNVTKIDINNDEISNETSHVNNDATISTRKQEDINKLGAVGFQVVDEDGEQNVLELDITDIEAITDEQDLRNTRRQSISDRLNKRRNSEMMAEIIRLSAENRQKDFRNLLYEHNKLVHSIDKGLLYMGNSPESSQIDLSIVDSMDGSLEDYATNSSHSIWGRNVRIDENDNNEGNEFLNSSSDEENLLSK